MNTRLLLLIIACLVILPILAFVYIRFTNQNLTKTQPATTKSRETIKKSPTPTSSPISKPIPVTTRTLRGTITTVSGSTITFNSGGKIENLSLKATTEVYKLTGGTIEGGDAKTAPARLEDIKTGQEALAIVDKNSAAVQRLVIIK